MTNRICAALRRVRGACRARPCDASIGPGQDRQDRRAERHVEPLCRHRRPQFRGRDQDGGRGFRPDQEGLEDRRRQRRSPEQAGCRRQHRAAVDRQRQGRRDRRYAELRRRARRQQPRQGKERGAAQFRRRDRRPHRQGLHAEHDLLHLRHLHARQRHRQGADQGRRRQLVLPDRRLCLRSRARARHRRRS